MPKRNDHTRALKDWIGTVEEVATAVGEYWWLLFRTIFSTERANHIHSRTNFNDRISGGVLPRIVEGHMTRPFTTMGRQATTAGSRQQRSLEFTLSPLGHRLPCDPYPDAVYRAEHAHRFHASSLLLPISKKPIRQHHRCDNKVINGLHPAFDQGLI
jgi:hypothetical protein